MSNILKQRVVLNKSNVGMRKYGHARSILEYNTLLIGSDRLMA